MASLVEQDVIAGAINTARLEPLFRSVYARQFSAQIYNLHKSRVELRVYVTDRSGRVLFDSLGRTTGADYLAVERREPHAAPACTARAPRATSRAIR